MFSVGSRNELELKVEVVTQERHWTARNQINHVAEHSDGTVPRRVAGWRQRLPGPRKVELESSCISSTVNLYLFLLVVLQLRLYRTPTMAPVKLYVYDLSKGLAKSMSMMLTGKQIDGIWWVQDCLLHLTCI